MLFQTLANDIDEVLFSFLQKARIEQFFFDMSVCVELAFDPGDNRWKFRRCRRLNALKKGVYNPVIVFQKLNSVHRLFSKNKILSR